MKAEKVELRCDTTVVVIKGDSYGENVVININGIYSSNLADGIVRMINENQCRACGKFNGLHGEIYIKTVQDGFGSVEGYYAMCPNSKVPKEK